MSHTLLRRLLLLPLLLVSGCAHVGARVDSVHESGVDFAKLRTFDLLPNATSDQVAALDSPLLDLVAQELQRKGLQRTKDHPDLLVAVHRTVEGVLDTRRSGYEIRQGRLSSFQLQEGMLVVDLITAADRHSVWRGTATGAFRADPTAEERAEFLADVLQRMFADFPPGR